MELQVLYRCVQETGVCLSGKHEDLIKTDHAAMECIDPNRRGQDLDNQMCIRDSVRTKDWKYAAHFEHTVAVGAGKADILSSFEFIEEVLGDKAI